MPDETIRSNSEVVLIGAGIMSATLGVILKELQPDIKMDFDFTNPETGETEVRPIPMGVGFFWPTE